MDDFFARNRLSAYLDGELPSSEAKEVEAALARSEELRAELDELRAAIELLRRGGPMTAPAGFSKRLEARLAGEPLKKRWMPRVRLDVAMIAAAAVVVLVFAARKPDAPAEDAPPPPVEAPVAAAEPAPEPVVASPPAPDGALEEPKIAKKATPAKAAEPSKKSSPRGKKGGGVEKEPFVPEWEQAEATGASPNALFSAPAMRYRLVPTRDTGLKELAAVAASLGGRLTDDKGRALAPYPMEPGESRVVRIEVPAYNVGAVESALGGVGSVQLVSMGSDATLYAKDASTAVTVEVRQP